MLPKVQISKQRIDRKGLFFQEMILLILDIIELILSFSLIQVCLIDYFRLTSVNNKMEETNIVQIVTIFVSSNQVEELTVQFFSHRDEQF